MDDEFNDMFTIEYESFQIDDELEYDVSEFDNLRSKSKSLLASTSESDSYTASLNLKPPSDSLKYFFKLDECLPLIIGSD